MTPCGRLVYRQLKCDRIRIHKNLFLSYILNGIAWILYYSLTAMNAGVLVRNPVGGAANVQICACVRVCVCVRACPHIIACNNTRVCPHIIACNSTHVCPHIIACNSTRVCPHIIACNSTCVHVRALVADLVSDDSRHHSILRRLQLLLDVLRRPLSAHGRRGRLHHRKAAARRLLPHWMG